MIYIPYTLPLKCIAPFVYIIKYKGTVQQLLQRMGYENTQFNRRWFNNSIKEITDAKALNAALIKTNTYEFSTIQYNPGTYYSCDFKAIDLIMHLDEKCNKIDLAGYYAILMSTVNTKTKAGHNFISTLSGRTGLCKKTILRYNKILEDYKLIYMIHSTVKGQPNYYGAYNDSPNIIKARLTNKSNNDNIN